PGSNQSVSWRGFRDFPVTNGTRKTDLRAPGETIYGEVLAALFVVTTQICVKRVSSRSRFGAL
ncbi:MAG: hypothetical protein WCK65_09100, partial [Rhodospirillaceae bacterium]